jgi:hypothetical protein
MRDHVWSGSSFSDWWLPVSHSGSPDFMVSQAGPETRRRIVEAERRGGAKDALNLGHNPEPGEISCFKRMCLGGALLRHRYPPR